MGPAKADSIDAKGSATEGEGPPVSGAQPETVPPPPAHEEPAAAAPAREEAPAAAPAQEDAPAPTAAPAHEEALAPAPAVQVESAAQVRAAEEDLERGEEIFTKGQGIQRFESAAEAMTAAIDKLMPLVESLEPEGRRVLARALDARAQCRFLQARSEETESDFALLVMVDPSYALDPAVTSSKILDRFRKIRDARVALVTLQVNPAGAAIAWNGRRIVASLSPELAVPAGPFVLLASSDCYRSAEMQGSLAPGEKKVVAVRLDPIGRNVRFESSPPGFEVELDGKVAGGTTAVIAPAPGQPAGSSTGTFIDSCVSAGEHTYRLRKECYEDTTGTITVDIDFDDRTAVLVPKVAPARLEVLLSVLGDVPGAAVSVNGSSVGSIPVEGVRLCRGKKLVEVRLGTRLVWSGLVEPVASGPFRVEARARPLLRTIILGTPGGPGEPGLSAETAALIRDRTQGLAAFNQLGSAPDEEGRGVLRAVATSSVAGGTSGHVDLGADLLLAADGQDTERGRAVRLQLISSIPGPIESVLCPEDDRACILRFLAGLEKTWPESLPETGLGLAPWPGGPGLLVVSARAAATAAGVKEGDRILEAGGEKAGNPKSVCSAAQRVLEEAEHETAQARAVPIVVERAGQRLEILLPVREAPVVLSPGRAAVPVARVLATAEMEAAVLPAGEARNAARLNLASALIGRGEYARALGLALERPGWAEGIGGAAATGVAKYLAGRCHEALDAREKAVAAFTSAADDSSATFWEPDGLPVAPLARLKLAAAVPSH